MPSIHGISQGLFESASIKPTLLPFRWTFLRQEGQILKESIFQPKKPMPFKKSVSHEANYGISFATKWFLNAGLAA